MLEKTLMRLVMLFAGGVLLAGALGDSLTFGVYPDNVAWPALTSPGRLAFVGVKIAMAALGLWMIYRSVRPKAR